MGGVGSVGPKKFGVGQKNGVGGVGRDLKGHSCRFENLPVCSCSYKSNTLKISYS